MSDQFEARLRQAVCEAGDLLDASLPPADRRARRVLAKRPNAGRILLLLLLCR